MTLITPEELADLEAKARAATPGPWYVEKGLGEGRVPCLDNIRSRKPSDPPFEWMPELWIYEEGHNRRKWVENAAYIAANAPDVTLRLIATIRAPTARAAAAERALAEPDLYG